MCSRVYPGWMTSPPAKEVLVRAFRFFMQLAQLREMLMGYSTGMLNGYVILLPVRATGSNRNILSGVYMPVHPQPPPRQPSSCTRHDDGRPFRGVDQLLLDDPYLHVVFINLQVGLGELSSRAPTGNHVDEAVAFALRYIQDVRLRISRWKDSRGVRHVN